MKVKGGGRATILKFAQDSDKNKDKKTHTHTTIILTSFLLYSVVLQRVSQTLLKIVEKDADHQKPFKTKSKRDVKQEPKLTGSLTFQLQWATKIIEFSLQYQADRIDENKEKCI